MKYSKMFDKSTYLLVPYRQVCSNGSCFWLVTVSFVLNPPGRLGEAKPEREKNKGRHCSIHYSKTRLDAARCCCCCLREWIEESTSSYRYCTRKGREDTFESFRCCRCWSSRAAFYQAIIPKKTKTQRPTAWHTSTPSPNQLLARFVAKGKSIT